MEEYFSARSQNVRAIDLEGAHHDEQKFTIICWTSKGNCLCEKLQSQMVMIR